MREQKKTQGIHSLKPRDHSAKQPPHKCPREAAEPIQDGLRAQRRRPLLTAPPNHSGNHTPQAAINTRASAHPLSTSPVVVQHFPISNLCQVLNWPENTDLKTLLSGTLQSKTVGCGPEGCPEDVQFSRSVVTLCDPMNHSTPGFPFHHQLAESTQTHVH